MKNYWHYEGQKEIRDNKLFALIRRKFFNNRGGLAQSIIYKEIFNKYIKKNPKKITLLDIGGAGGHQFDSIPIKGKHRIDIDGNKLKESKGWHNFIMNAENIDFESNSFDLISCFQVLEHTKDPLKIMKEMYKVLKPNGRILITVPNLKSVGFSFYDYYTHIFPFTQRRIEFMLKSCGFKIELSKTMEIPKHWYFLYRFPKLLLRYMFYFKSASILIIAKK